MSMVHIVLATYNAKKYIREQLDSILNGDYKDISIEVCDDGSTDSTLDIVKEYIEKYKSIISLHENKKNMGYQRNFLEGVKRSQSPYIMLCDQDDIWLKDKVSLTLKKMKKIEENQKEYPILVFTDAILYDGVNQEELGSFHKNSHLATEKVDISHLLMENKIIGCTTMVNQKILPYLNVLPKEIRVHDWWMALICATFGQIGYIERGTVLYRQHSNNIIGGTSFVKYFGNRLTSLREQKQVLKATFEQAKAFYELFEGQLSTDRSIVIKRFADIPRRGFLERRIRCIQNGYLKSGVARNVALLLIL